MGKLEIVLTGRIPSKKNSKQWIKRGGRMLLVPSDNYAAWHEEKMWELKKYRIKTPIKKCRMKVQIVFPDNRRSDLSNKFESLADLLVDAKILDDDDHKVLTGISVDSLGVDKENPRAIIIIET